MPPEEMQGRLSELEAMLAEYERRFRDTRQSEQWYRAIVDDGLGLICVHDLDGVMISISPAAAQLLEYAPNELIGRPIVDLMPDDFRPFFADYLKRVAQNKVDVGMMRLLTKSGEERLWAYRNTSMEGVGAEPQILGHAQDITALHRTRNELREARNHLEDRVRMRTAELVEANRRLQQEVNKRRQMEDELRSSRKRLELFHEIATRAAVCQSRKEVAEFVVERCGRALSGASVSFVGVEAGRLVVRNSTAYDDPTWEVGGSPDLKDVYLTQLSAGDMVISDVAALVAYPVRESESLLGILCVRADGPRSWSDYEVETVREVAGFLSLAMRRSGVFPAIADQAA